MEPILIVDDEVEMRIAMSETLKHSGYEVELAHTAADAWKKLSQKPYSLVITDMTMPKKSGLELLKDIKKAQLSMPVIMVTAYGTIDTAVKAMKEGAFDYILKPFKFEVFTFVVERALCITKSTAKYNSTSLQSKGEPPLALKTDDAGKSKQDFITADDATQKLMDMAKNIAKSNATVLIESESGTGKEMLASFIHQHSPRAEGPFVAVNCAALPESLLESELFGHKKGAFTGAIQDHKGKFEQAHKGTILLDEISEMAPALQAKLLRVLQEHEIDKVGGKEPLAIDVRVIATTNRDLFACVEAGEFREDLFYRVNVIPLSLPPLRERKGDIPLLAEYFVLRHAAKNACQAVEISPAAMEVLYHYNWRGNVRELENIMERALLMVDSGNIEPAHLMMNAASIKKKALLAQIGITIGMSMQEAERRLIIGTLKATHGEVAKAAKILELPLNTLQDKIDTYQKKLLLPEELLVSLSAKAS